MRGTVCPHVKIYGVHFVSVFKPTGYYLSACANRRGTICPHVQIDGVLFVRMCKNDGVLFVRGTICPVPQYHFIVLYTQRVDWLTAQKGLVCTYLSPNHV